MALPINVGQVAGDATAAAIGAIALDGISEYLNIKFLNDPAIIGTGMSNVELLLYLSGGLALAGSIFSMISKRKLLGGAEKNMLGYGGGLILGTQIYESIIGPKFIRTA